MSVRAVLEELLDAGEAGVVLCANAKEARPAETIRVVRAIFMVDSKLK